MDAALNAAMLVGGIIVAIYGIVFAVGLLACAVILVGVLFAGIGTWDA